MMGMGQSRTQGLGRAIVDTFPIIKFGRDNNPHPSSMGKDAEANYPSGRQNMEMRDIQSPHSPGHAMEKDHQDAETSQGDATSVGQSSSHEQHQTPPGVDTVNPAAIGHETCPICIVDFEEGDDLRVLPCEGKHRFHQACVDPWLLELSSSCPLCREGMFRIPVLC